MLSNKVWPLRWKTQLLGQSSDSMPPNCLNFADRNSCHNLPARGCPYNERSSLTTNLVSFGYLVFQLSSHNSYGTMTHVSSSIGACKKACTASEREVVLFSQDPKKSAKFKATKAVGVVAVSAYNTISSASFLMRSPLYTILPLYLWASYGCSQCLMPPKMCSEAILTVTPVDLDWCFRLWSVVSLSSSHVLLRRRPCASSFLLQISSRRSNALSRFEKDLQCVQDVLVRVDVQLTPCFPMFRYPNPSHTDSLFWIPNYFFANLNVVVCVPDPRTATAKMLESPNYASDACALLRRHSKVNVGFPRQQLQYFVTKHRRMRIWQDDDLEWLAPLICNVTDSTKSFFDRIQQIVFQLSVRRVWEFVRIVSRTWCQSNDTIKPVNGLSPRSPAITTPCRLSRSWSIRSSRTSASLSRTSTAEGLSTATCFAIAFGFADGADANEGCLTDGFGLAFDLDKSGFDVETFAVLIRSEIDGPVCEEDDAPNGSWGGSTCCSSSASDSDTWTGSRSSDSISLSSAEPKMYWLRRGSQFWLMISSNLSTACCLRLL